MRSTTRLPNCFIAGCQKTGSTWLYHCFKEHPEIFVPSIDRLNYFSFQHYRGIDWLKQWYEDVESQKAICDPTPSYFQAPGVAKRIHEHDPGSKIIITLRNPVERSYSHYKHLYRKGHISVDFDQALFKANVGSFDFFRLLIHPSLYYDKLAEFYNVFPAEQILITFFEDLSSDPKQYLRKVFEFLEVDASFSPNIVDKKVNTADQRAGKIDFSKGNFTDKIKNGELIASARRTIANQFAPKEQSRTVASEIPKNMRLELNRLFKEDIAKTSVLTGRDLNHWF